MKDRFVFWGQKIRRNISNCRVLNYPSMLVASHEFDNQQGGDR